MANPLVRRQIPNSLGTTTSQTLPSQPTPSPVIPTTSSSSNGPRLSISSIVSEGSSRGPVSSAISSTVARPTSSTPSSTSSTSVPSVLPADTPSLPTSQAGEPTTITQTSSATDSPSSTGIPGVKGKSFLENKPLSGFVFGLSGLVFLILVFVIVTSFMRRRNRKRLLADASNFSFDPRDVEDGASDEKYSHSGLVNQHSIGHGHNDYPLDGRVATAIGGGSISRSGPSHSPPMPNYIPQDYGSYDGSYLAQYHNMGNVPVGYNPTPNPYDMYGPRNGGVYPNGRVHHDPYNLSGPNGGNFSEPDSDHSVPRQLHPGVRPAQGPTFSPRLSNNALSYQAPPIASTTPAPAPPYLQSSVSDKDDIARLPTPNFLPDTFGQQDSVDSVDDAYGGAFLGPESPPEQRTLQVANM